MKEYILILTHEFEVNVDIIILMLKKRGFSVVRINTEQFPKHISFSLGLEKEKCFILHKDDIYLSSENVRSCWYRQPWTPSIKKEDVAGYGRLVKEESKATIWSLATTLDTFWMNNPLAVCLLDNNKLYI